MKAEYKKFESYIRKWPIIKEQTAEQYIEDLISRVLEQIEYVSKNNAFDSEYYINRYPEVLKLEISPIEHYFFQGFLDNVDNGRKNPSENFDTAQYYDIVKNYTNITINPLYHYTFLKNSIESKGLIKGEVHEHVRFSFSEDVDIIALDKNKVTHKNYDLKILIHIHGFYVDLVEDIVKRFVNINCVFKFIITTDTNDKKKALTDMFFNYPLNIDVIQVKNIGRDVAPLFVELKDKVKKYDLLLHIHTKKSMHYESGDMWYEDLLNKLVCNQNYIKNVIDLFEQNGNLGVAIPTIYPPLRRLTAWNKNYTIAKDIISKSKYNVEALERFRLKFPVGNMFWARVDAIHTLFEIELEYSDFPQEPLPNDGTIAHTLERLLCFVAEQEGYCTCAIEPTDELLIQ